MKLLLWKRRIKMLNKFSLEEIANFSFGKQIEESVINLLHQGLDFCIHHNGIEHKYGFYTKRISKIANELKKNSNLHPTMDKTSKRVLIQEAKAPDVVAYKYPNFSKIEIRHKLLNDELEETIGNFYVQEDFNFLRDYLRDSLILYCCPKNKKIRILNTTYEITNPVQEDYWNNPEKNFGVPEKAFDNFAERYVFNKQFLINKLINSCAEEHLPTIYSNLSPISLEVTELEEVVF